MNIFFECLKKHCLDGICDKDNNKTFFNSWFREQGKAYTFVYKQNLRVTNIQQVELLVLLKRFCSVENKDALFFISSREFADRIEKIINFIEKRKIDTAKKKGKLSRNLEYKLLRICKTYEDLFNHLIVVDPFFCSSAVFLPHGIDIDLKSICYFSGYIHSCGENIYTRSMIKATKEEFFSNLLLFKKGKRKEKIENMRLMLYTHEDFTPFDRSIGNHTDFLKNGLDGIKFYIEKYYMQKNTLYSIFESLKKDKKLGNFYDVMPSGNYNKTKDHFTETSVWLIVDYSVGDSLQFPGDDKYYICYHQIYKNENPFHLYDENKPGWIDHVTIPHTLSGAMINIAVSLCGNKKNLKAIDPFVGAGTTYLEALKHDDLAYSGSDINGLSRISTKDNLCFFCISYYDLKGLLLFIAQIINNSDSKITIPKFDALKNGRKGVSNSIITTLDKNLNLIYEFVQSSTFKNIKEKDFRSWVANFADSILKQSDQEKIAIPRYKLLFTTRILIYTMIKAYKRNIYAILRTRENWKETFYSELLELFSRAMAFMKHKGRNSDNSQNSKETSIVYNAPYSKAISINPSYIFQKFKKLTTKTLEPECDVLQKLKALISKGEKYDIILTDPPYGFNTNEEKTTFSKLYSRILPLFIKVLCDNGIIMLCLPAQSHSGKAVDYFVQKEIVLQQLYIAAIQNNMILREKIEINRVTHNVYTTSLYWDSEKALKRDIVCFQFSKLSEERNL
jgi:tRNA G10  N-methylase Trm11